MPRKSRSRKAKKGTKRSLAAANLEEQDTNGRASKRRRISKDYEASLTALLAMTEDEISQLPDALRKQAITLRQSQSNQSASNQQNSDNKNTLQPDSSISSANSEGKMSSNLEPPKTSPFYSQKAVDPDSDSESEDSDSDTENESDSPATVLARSRNKRQPNRQNNRRRVRDPSPPISQLQAPGANQEGVLLNTMYQRPQHRPQITSQLTTTIPSHPQLTQLRPAVDPLLHHRSDRPTYSSMQYDAYKYPLNQAPPLPSSNTPKRVPPVSTVRPFHIDSSSRLPRLPSLDEEPIVSITWPSCRCLCSTGSLWFVLGFILLIPMLMAVMRSNSHGSNFCDTNARVTDHCIECPENAHFCIGGRAWCEDRSYWVDPTLNRCVKRSYLDDIANNYKIIGQVIFDLVRRGCVYLWNEMKSSWLKGIDEHSFEAVCKLFEVEIMIGWFMYLIILRCVPSLRLIGILIWSRLVFPIVPEEDLWMSLGLNVLSVVTVHLIARHLWCKFGALFGSS